MITIFNPAAMANCAGTGTAASNSPVCQGATLNLSSTVGVSYSWSGPNNFTSTDQNPSIISAGLVADGEYYVTITDGVGCQQTDSTRVMIGALPNATIYPGGPDTICPGNPLMLSPVVGSGQTAIVHAPGATGTNLICNCPQGYVAVGYTSRTGAWMDQFSLACKQLNRDGSLGTNVVYTSSNGISTGGGPHGPFFLAGTT